LKDFSLQDENTLNFDLNSQEIFVSSRNQNILNFDSESTRLSINISDKILNFELKDYDETTKIYRILLDFIESLTVGDIF
jgi:hypothetical protein